jgi:O-antigen ligase
VAPETTADPQGSVVPTAPAPAAAVASKGEVSLSPVVPKDLNDQTETSLITNNFFKFSGRTAVWVEGWRLFKTSPLIGFGFHADRLMLGTHLHNSMLQALLQAGLIGAIPFVAAVIFGWVSFFRIVLKLAQIPVAHKHLVIQCGGVLAFLTMRSLPESTGAFFGVDWLILAPVLFYLQVVNNKQQPAQDDISHRRLER